MSHERIESRANPQPVPEPVAGQPGLMQVVATWGTIAPMQLAEGVRTIGELEVLKHLEEGRPVVDSRTPDFDEKSTIPGTKNIPHPEAITRMEDFGREHPTVFFCNGPQCGQSPTAIRALLDAGYPPDKRYSWVKLPLGNLGLSRLGASLHLERGQPEQQTKRR